MENIEQQIINAKNFIFNNDSNNSNYRSVWYGATETIKEYVEALNWTNVNSALTVCSSGDHIFNLINKGVKRIDSFDINPLTFPYFKLREGIMKAFSYQDFYKFFERLTIIATNEKKEYDYFSIIKPFIEKPYDYFWEELYLENLRSNVHDITTPGLLSLMCMN